MIDDKLSYRRTLLSASYGRFYHTRFADFARHRLQAFGRIEEIALADDVVALENRAGL